MKVKYRPLNNSVLVKVDEVVEKTSGGIYLPDQAKEDKTEGTIISIGDKVESVKVGDHILFGMYAGDGVLINGEKCKVIKESEILLIKNAAK